MATLEDLLVETDLRAVRGQRSVVVKLAWANKGEAVARLEADGFAPDFRLALGDDRTDEDLIQQTGLDRQDHSRLMGDPLGKLLVVADGMPRLWPTSPAAPPWTVPVLHSMAVHV